MSIQEGINQASDDNHDRQAKAWFQKLVQEEQYIGELYSINYETAKVIIHDYQKNKVGGVPSLSFLIATRVNPYIDKTIDFHDEDSSAILLRVMDSASLPQDKDNERMITQAAQNLYNDPDKKNWGLNFDKNVDPQSRNILGFAGIECRIIGTFYLDLQKQDQQDSDLVLKFGCDISNYYPNRGLKVYKPNARALQEIINYIDNSILEDYKKKYGTTARVQLGNIRYASTNRRFQQIDDVKVSIFPADLLSQKTALFGMTRTGKSNTTKIIAKSVYELRYPKSGDSQSLRIGQIIFDPNGEYANENTQDIDRGGNANALKNIYQVSKEAIKEEEVVTYGITSHPNDPDRKLMLLNFYLDKNLSTGKEIIDSFFQEKESKFIENFKQIIFEIPDEQDKSASTRFKRRRLAYLSLLAKAEFDIPDLSKDFNYSTDKLFRAEMFDGRPNARDEDYRFHGMLDVISEPDKSDVYKNAAKVFKTPQPNLKKLAEAFIVLNDFMKTTEYKKFEQWYSEKESSTGDNWADEDFKKILLMLAQPNGAKQIGKARPFHTPSTDSDYAEDIYTDLVKGKLVIIDQSSGEPDINKSSAERIMWMIFRKNQSLFREGIIDIPNVIVYIEEAHNLLPSGSNLDLSNVWVRTAKEGAKYHIGMVYSTQEVSSIQKNILKNTANWFIAHLNNTDETKELCKYYDFADFERSIRRTQDKGFLRVKTLSNYFVIPVQVKEFNVTDKS